MTCRSPASASPPVFICYAWSDREQVRPLVDAVTAAGIPVWLDEQRLAPGEPWELPLQRALLAAHVLVLFIGPRGVGRTQNTEWSHARSGLPGPRVVVPVFLPGAPFAVYAFREDDRPVVLAGDEDAPRAVVAAIRSALLEAHGGQCPGP